MMESSSLWLPQHYILTSDQEIPSKWHKHISTLKKTQILAGFSIAAVVLFLCFTSFHQTYQTNETDIIENSHIAENSSIVTFDTTIATERPLILYVYHETENARENAEFFINHAIHDAADFVIILNGETSFSSFIPGYPYITVIQRDNTCYDLGAVAEVLLADNRRLLNKYNKFIFLNASIRGPFLPVWSRECWSEAYLDRVTDQVKMVGISYNCRPMEGFPSHIQSMLIATDRTGMDILLDKQQMGKCFDNWSEAREAEIGLTKAITQAGYKVEALMTAFSSQSNFANYCTNADPLGRNNYYGFTMHPYEAMFVKANRETPIEFHKFTEWHNGMRYSSQDVCGSQRKQR